ncbi:MAG: SRPBCC domain-containing protein [Pseudoxanthomonas sp.]
MPDRAATENTQDTNYSKAIHIEALIESVYAAIATLEGINAWWDGSVSGDASEQGELRFSLHDSDDYTQMKVDSAIFPTDVAWSVLEDSGYGGEWIGTSILFHIEEDVDGSCTLTLHHQGLTPTLDCFGDCKSGWDRHLEKIRENAELASQ